MKIQLQFGFLEPKREASWYKDIKDFPHLVTYKSDKWEFLMYQQDDTKKVDYILHFGKVPSYDPNWHATTYVDVNYLFTAGWGDCVCGSIYTSFPDFHMMFCPKWTKW